MNKFISTVASKVGTVGAKALFKIKKVSQKSLKILKEPLKTSSVVNMTPILLPKLKQLLFARKKLS